MALQTDHPRNPDIPARDSSAVHSSPSPDRTRFSRRTALLAAFATMPLAAAWALNPVVTTKRASAVVFARSRESDYRSRLVPGTYRPGPSTTGPLPGLELGLVDGDLVVERDNQVIENLDVSGTVNLLGHRGVTIRNCVIRGTVARGTDSAFVIAEGDDCRGLIIQDCIFAGRGNPWCSGMRGANYSMRRTEITGAPDGLCLTSALGNVSAEGCWIHNGLYLEWSAGTPEMPEAGNNYTHTDGIQFHRGKHYLFRGNTIGGVRVPADHGVGLAPLINSGDDMYNSAIMIKQEVDDSAANKIEDVLIESNWLGGGAATINLSSGRGNAFSSTVIRNNRFIRATWGEQLYILRGQGLGQVSANVFDDDGTAVPVTPGY